MNGSHFGQVVADRRRALGMTQQDLAQVMGVTDKAVSKWERNLSRPDVDSIPKLAATLEVSVEELLQAQEFVPIPPLPSLGQVSQLVLRAVALGMGVAVTALSLLGELTAQVAFPMLGLGLACLATVQLSEK